MIFRPPMMSSMPKYTRQQILFSQLKTVGFNLLYFNPGLAWSIAVIAMMSWWVLCRMSRSRQIFLSGLIFTSDLFIGWMKSPPPMSTASKLCVIAMLTYLGTVDSRGRLAPDSVQMNRVRAECLLFILCPVLVRLTPFSFKLHLSITLLS